MQALPEPPSEAGASSIDSKGNHHMKNMRNSIGMALALAPQGIFPSIRREEGQTLAEYALILALIAVLVVGAVLFLSGQIRTVFSDIANNV
jgi:Flp pilus assembly pilin Flp